MSDYGKLWEERRGLVTRIEEFRTTKPATILSLQADVKKLRTMLEALEIIERLMRDEES